MMIDNVDEDGVVINDDDNDDDGMAMNDDR